MVYATWFAAFIDHSHSGVSVHSGHTSERIKFFITLHKILLHGMNGINEIHYKLNAFWQSKLSTVFVYE